MLQELCQVCSMVDYTDICRHTHPDRFNIVGQWAVTTSVDFSRAQWIQVIILLSTGGKNGSGYDASKYVVIGLHGGILLLHAILNSLPISLLSFFSQLAAARNVAGVFVLMTLIPLVAKEKASAKFVFTHFNTDNGEGINSRRMEPERTLTDRQRDEFEDMLRALMLERCQIKNAMGFALDNADAAGELLQMILPSNLQDWQRT